MTQTDAGAMLPHVRPHNRWHDGQMFFMVSTRPLLSMTSHELELYNAIDGHKSVDELESLYPGARDLLLTWTRAEVIQLVPPITPPSRPHLVVIEPHMDDAALSAGGHLIHRRGTQRITVLSVVRRSMFTSYLTLGRVVGDVDEISELREKESILLAKVLAAEAHSLGWRDGPLNFFPEPWPAAVALEFSKRWFAFVNLLPVQADVARLADELAERLRRLQPDELWIPMGIGGHSDHLTTRSACLRLLAAHDQFSNIPVFMYEDTPYATDRKHIAQIRDGLAACGVRLAPAAEDITDVFAEKLRILSIYASQFKVSFMEPRLRKIAEWAAGEPGKFAEKFYRVQGVRSAVINETELVAECTSLKKLAERLRPLTLTCSGWRRLTVLALPSGHLGRWPADCDALLRAFPNARIQLYVPEDLKWQIKGVLGSQLRVKIVRKGLWGVLRSCITELFHFRNPVIVLWCAAYDDGFKKTLLRMAFPFRPLVLSSSLQEVRWVLSEELERTLVRTASRNQA